MRDRSVPIPLASSRQSVLCEQTICPAEGEHVSVCKPGTLLHIVVLQLCRGRVCESNGFQKSSHWKSVNRERADKRIPKFQNGLKTSLVQKMEIESDEKTPVLFLMIMMDGQNDLMQSCFSC